MQTKAENHITTINTYETTIMIDTQTHTFRILQENNNKNSKDADYWNISTSKMQTNNYAV